MQKIKIIYLDIDGVLTSFRYWKEVPTEVRESQEDRFGQPFDPYSSSLLNKLIDETGAKVVISSIWRHDGLEVMQEMWKERGLSGEVIDITPDYERKIDLFCVPRGCEIQAHYQNEHGFGHWKWDGKKPRKAIAESTLENYVIIDDESCTLYEQRNHFVLCRYANGFTQKEYKLAKKILMRTFDEIHPF